MPKFSRSSIQKLSTCHESLQQIAHKAIIHTDFTVLEGHRDQKQQDLYYSKGVSKLKFPHSKHNSSPSRAFDIAPYISGKVLINPAGVAEYGQFYYMAGVVMSIAHNLGTPLRWGGDWNNNGAFSDNNFNDLFHFELR